MSVTTYISNLQVVQLFIDDTANHTFTIFQLEERWSAVPGAPRAVRSNKWFLINNPTTII